MQKRNIFWVDGVEVRQMDWLFSMNGKAGNIQT